MAEKTEIAYWKQPLRWAKAARGTGRRPKVFCASLSDVFDNQAPREWRADLWKMVWATPELDWLFLTKRPENIEDMLPESWRSHADEWSHVWLGTTCEDHENYRRRYGILSCVPAKVRFISYEPAIGPIRIDWVPSPRVHRPDWLICGGESGAGAREMDPAWARMVRDHCADFGIPFFMKQMTGKTPIPADLMVRQFPTAAAA